MKRMKRVKYLQTIILALLCTIFLIIGLVYTRAGDAELYGDEFYSYGLANSEMGCFYYQEHYYEVCGVGGWTPGQDIRNWMEVQPGNRFQYSNVWKNQAGDVHPPLYYFLLHTLCSIVTDSHSKWIGLSINVLAFFFIFLGIIQWFLYMQREKNLKCNWGYALLPCVLLMMIPGTQYVLRYIRMYALLMAECTWMNYALYRVMRENRFTKRQALLLGLVVLCGGLTHYYFYVYSFFLAIFTGISLIIRKAKAPDIGRYIATWSVSIVCCFIIFPASIRHLFFSYRAEQLQENLSGSNEILICFIRSLPEWCFSPKFLILMLIVSFLILLIQRKYSWDVEFALAILGGSISGLLIMKTAIYAIFYYVAPIFIYVAIWESKCISEILRQKYVIYKITCGIISLAILWSGIHNVRTKKNTFADNKEGYIQGLEHLGIVDCYFVQQDTEWNNLFDGWIEDLSRCDEWTIGHEEEFPEGWFFKVMNDRITDTEPLVLLIRREYWENLNVDYKDQFEPLLNKGKYLYLYYEG